MTEMGGGGIGPTAVQGLAGLRPVQARVDLDRLAGNYRALSTYSPVPLMPVVKADAYGHGAAVVGRHLEELGAPMLAVAYVEEGALLRAAGVRVPVVVLAGFTREQVGALLDRKLTPVVSTPGQLECLLAHLDSPDTRLPVHVKVDTGMSRLGFPPELMGSAVGRLLDSGRVDVEGVMTQLASADEDREATIRQLDLFDDALSHLAARGVRPRWAHAANSAGLAYLRPTHTLARPGLLIYGLEPRPLSPPVEVHPVMTVQAEVFFVKEVPIGTAVSYGRRWVAQRPSRIATVPLGYADGVPRTAGMATRGQFSIRGRRVPVAGTVCMDLTMIDLTEHGDAREGDEVVLFGDDPTAWDVAEWAGTNAWEVLTRVGSRVPRVYVEGGRVVAVGSHFSR